MVVSCEEVQRQVSNYLDGEVEPALRAAMEEHFRLCKKCAAVRDGMRNVVELYGDERTLEVPSGYSRRLHQKLEVEMARERGSAWGWVVALAAAILLVGSFEIASVSAVKRQPLRSEHAQPGTGVPSQMMVVVANDGKTFHAVGCKFIHDRSGLKTIPAGEAIREGYTPCVRCMKQYLTDRVIAHFPTRLRTPGINQPPDQPKRTDPVRVIFVSANLSNISHGGPSK
jgi:hypothetical protein